MEVTRPTLNNSARIQRAWLIWGSTGSYECSYHVVAAYVDEAQANARCEELKAVVWEWSQKRYDLPTPEIEDTPENDKLHERWNATLKRMERKYRKAGRDPNMEYDTTYSVGMTDLYI